jgi:hypothetical protein
LDGVKSVVQRFFMIKLPGAEARGKRNEIM